MKIEIGNNAKLREALTKAKEFIVKITDSWRETEGVECGEDEILHIINDALAEHPRHCDIPSIIAHPHQAWLDDADNWTDFGDPILEIQDWLLAKSKES